MSPWIRCSSSISGSRSMRPSNMMRSASSVATCGPAVFNWASGVMKWSTISLSCERSHGISRRVSTPARIALPGEFSIRMPLILYLRANARASPIVEPAGSVRGCSITALWLRLTRATVSLWRSMLCPRCTTPNPPSSAMVCAMSPPVTLSILDEIMGNSKAMA